MRNGYGNWMRGEECGCAAQVESKGNSNYKVNGAQLKSLCGNWG